VWRRSPVLVMAGLTVVLTAGVALLWPTQPSRLTIANLRGIREGMTQAEVEAILGPPADYRTGPSWLSGNPLVVR
jgi:hypothetical protein